MKRPYSRYVERRRREIANERDELTSKIAAMIPEVEAIAKNSPNAEAREVAQKWLALVTPEERSRAASVVRGLRQSRRLVEAMKRAHIRMGVK